VCVCVCVCVCVMFEGWQFIVRVLQFWNLGYIYGMSSLYLHPLCYFSTVYLPSAVHCIKQQHYSAWGIMMMSVCLSVCLSACTSQEPDDHISTNFLCILPMAMAQFSSDGGGIYYVSSVLWMTSWLEITARNERCKKGVYCILTVTHEGSALNQGQSLLSTTCG